MGKSILSFLLSSLFFVNFTYAQSSEVADIGSSGESVSTAVTSKILSLKGIVKSADRHWEGKRCKVTLEFTDSESGKTYELEDAKSLADLHCEKEKDFKVKLTAEKEAAFLFWGGDLKVKSFEILEEITPAPHIAEYNTERRNTRFGPR